MSDELIRKSDVLDLLDDLRLNLFYNDIYSRLFDTVNNMPPVNAVELPCKVGDKIILQIISCRMMKKAGLRLLSKRFKKSGRVKIKWTIL